MQILTASVIACLLMLSSAAEEHRGEPTPVDLSGFCEADGVGCGGGGGQQ